MTTAKNVVFIGLQLENFCLVGGVGGIFLGQGGGGGRLSTILTGRGELPPIHPVG